MQLKFSLEDFKRLDTADLIINIWSYNHNSHVQCVKCKQYSNYCDKILKEKWKPEYGVFYHVAEKFKKNDETFIDVGGFSSENRHEILNLLKQNKFFFLIC